MKKLKLKGALGGVTLVDDDDYVLLNRFRWHRDTAGYVSGTVGGKEARLQRFLMNPKREELVDHINHNPLDNRKSNLRICTQKQNGYNKRLPKHNTSGYKGVCWVANKKWWLARISFDGKMRYIGTSREKEVAARMYDQRATELYGEFAALNFPV